ncbi:MAG: LptF/LptG family permease, partial [Thermodesulfovibrionales bacterium]
SISKELFFIFLICLAFLNFILMMEKVLRLSRLLSGTGISVIDMIKIFLYIQPHLLILTIPMAFLLATLLTYGRLNHDNEIVILRTTGMSFRDISMPVFAFGLLCFLFNLTVSLYLGPKSSLKLRDEITRIITVRTPLAIEEGTFNTSFKDIVFIIKEKLSNDTFRGIFLYDGRNKAEPKVMLARGGKISMSEGLETNLFLKDGYIHIAKGENITEIFFDKYNFVMRLETELPSRKNSELSFNEIIHEIKKGVPHISSLQLEMHRRLSLPLLCIILVFLGPPLSMIAGKSSRLGGLSIGLGVFTIYYVLLIYGENLVKAGKIPHYAGAWGPTILLVLCSLWLFVRESKR